VADLLSRIERASEDSPIHDDFLDDHLYFLYNISDSFLSQHALLRACEARLTGVLSKGGNMRGVATNIYLWKMSEKHKETSQNENSKFGSYIYV